MATKNIVPRGDGEGSLGTSSKRWGDIQTKKLQSEGELTAGSITTEGELTAGSITTEGELTAGSITTEGELTAGSIMLNNSPVYNALDLIGTTEDYYKRPSFFTVAKTTITIPSGMQININNKGYVSVQATQLQLNSVGAASARKGKDVYIYACEPESGTAPVFVLSMNSTVPANYTAQNSRKIGGFHCLAVDVGTISGHTLSGYVAGDILPQTVWDLIHRPACDSPEGMFYVPETDTWMDIYGLSWDGSKLVSVYGGTWADGTSAKKWHGEATLEQLQKQGKRLAWRHEFQMAAKGSNENTNIQGNADPTTTGGHVDTAGRRMISNYGGEDMCGVLWQWCMDLGFAGGTGWVDCLYNNAVDDRSYGQSYGNLYRLFVGGCWNVGTYCGSRCADCGDVSAHVLAIYGARGACEPLFRKALKRKTA